MYLYKLDKYTIVKQEIVFSFVVAAKIITAKEILKEVSF